MSNFTFRYPASAIAGKHQLTANDILLLRKHMFPKGLISIDDVQQLLALHRSPSEKCAQWETWFVEMITAFIVGRTLPHYLLDERNAAWLIDLVSHHGVIETAAELELVLHALEMSASVPDALSAFALDQLRIALELKKGAYTRLRHAKRSGIGAGDIEFIHRILRRTLAAGKMVLGIGQVTVLRRIDAVVRGQANHPGWQALIDSIAERTQEGHIPATPWLQMPIEDAPLDAAA